MRRILNNSNIIFSVLSYVLVLSWLANINLKQTHGGRRSIFVAIELNLIWFFPTILKKQTNIYDQI